MTLSELNEQISQCNNCGLRKNCKQVVVGEGSENARIVFVAEAPGAKEDEQNRMFVGAAGDVLNDLLVEIQLSREDVYLANVVKCRPPQNGDPKAEEIAACRNWLDKQLEIINPEIIVPLGRFAMEQFVSGVKISQVHGRYRYVGDRLVFVMYHPAVALYNKNMYVVLSRDIKRLGKILRGEIEVFRD